MIAKRIGQNERKTERGSATVELVLLTPLFIALLLLVVAVGRLTQARIETHSAASDAARDASIERSPAAAQNAAEQIVLSETSGQSTSCLNPRVVLDTDAFVAGGQVGVTVTCTVKLSDLTLLRIPGSKDVTGHFVEPLDTYRGLDSAS